MGQFLGNNMPRHARRHAAVSSGTMAEQIDMPIWVVDSGWHMCYMGAHWRNLANTTYDWTVHAYSGGPNNAAARCGLTSNYFDHEAPSWRIL